MDIDQWIARWEGEGGAVPAIKTASKTRSRQGRGTAKRKTTGLRRILVPIDFSPDSLKTLRYAKLLADSFGAALHLVHVVTPPLIMPARRLTLPWAFSETEVAANARKRLKSLVAEHALPPRPSSFTVPVGRPAEEIGKVADATDADLIVIATRGYTGLQHAFLGSTTERVVREAPCPVLVVREKEAQSAKARARSGRSPLQFRKILVPVDFSAPSRLGVDYALRFARAFRANLVFFHSVFVHPPAPGDANTMRAMPSLIAAQQHYADEEMEKLRRSASQEGHEVEAEVTVGPAVDQITDYVTKQEVDLIITSTHGRSGLQRALAGSTAERLVRYAPCPVLVVPNRPRRKKTSKPRS